MPSVGEDAPPPELITNADGKFAPKDSVPENTERMTGGTQSTKPGCQWYQWRARRWRDGRRTVQGRADPEDGRGYKHDASEVIIPESQEGTLESDLLLSTFADAHLSTMSPSLMQQYDTFLDENDWDIYYWATQEPTPTSHETAEGAGSTMSTKNAQGMDAATQTKLPEKDERKRQPGEGEWAQTVGTFKPAYRPVPSRWKGSEISVY
ncbi:Sdh5 domain-containing protein [Pyrenophora tritici-repentis]|nr:Sdh5 domain-containing protein [Pyrenophora tritici-repentis]